MNNYPPGVTGNEFAIVGPDFEGDDPRPCPECGSDMYELGFQGSRWWNCEDCGHSTDPEYPEDEREPDPLWDDSDDIRDRLLDR